MKWKWKSEVAQSCPTLCNPQDCSPSGSSVHGILQARILEWVAILFSMGSSWPRDQTQVSCIAGRFFTAWAKICSILLQMSSATLKVNNIITLSSKDVSNVLVLLDTQSCSGNRKSLGRYMDGWAHFFFFSMPFSQIFPPSLSPTESIRLFYTSVSLLLSRIQGYCYHLSKFHIYVLVYCIGVFLSGLLHSV